MSAVSFNTFISFFPELAGTDLTAYNAVATRAALLSNNFIGECDRETAELIKGLLTAHMLVLNQRASCSGGSGIVRSVSSKDDQIVNFLADSFSDYTDWLKGSSYGTELLYYLDSRVPAFTIV